MNHWWITKRLTSTDNRLYNDDDDDGDENSDYFE
jgi:hypothetical protein